MSFIDIFLTLALGGVLIWFVQRVLPLRKNARNVVNVLVVVLAALWLLHGFGMLGPSGESMTLPDMK